MILVHLMVSALPRLSRLVFCLALVSGASAAFAQESTCNLYRVNVSMLPLSTEAGGPVNKGALFDGDIACITRTQPVSGRQWGYISYKLDNAKVRTPVERWSPLDMLQGLSSVEAVRLGGRAPPVPAAPPPAAAAAGWVRCATEGSFCKAPYATTVRYGENGKYTLRVAPEGGIQCDNSVFGDPLFGVRKICDYQVKQ